MKINSPTVYLDANFLIYWSVSKKPELKKRARVLIAKFLIQKSVLALSTLTFDEAWNGIRKELAFSSKSLSHFHPTVYSQIEVITNKILDHPSFKIIQFQNLEDGVRKALENIKKYQLKPRDSFHLAIAKDNGITKIVTDDKDFIDQQALMKIKVVSILKS